MTKRDVIDSLQESCTAAMRAYGQTEAAAKLERDLSETPTHALHQARMILAATERAIGSAVDVKLRRWM